MRPKNLLFCPELSFPRSIQREIAVTDPARRDVPGHAPAPALPTLTVKLIATTRGRGIPRILQSEARDLAANLAARNPVIPILRSLLLIDKVLNLFISTFWNPPQPGKRPTPAYYYDTCIYSLVLVCGVTVSPPSGLWLSSWLPDSPENWIRLEMDHLC